MTGGYTMKEKNIRELAKRMGLITVENMCQYTIAQLVVMVANKVNELVDEVWRFETDVQEILKTQNDNIQYLLGEGLHLEVGNIFDGWVQDGTFDTLINQSMQAIGYKEFADCNYVKTDHGFEIDPVELAVIKDKIKQHTRNYAKRQLTWFRKYDFVKWFDVGDQDGAIAYIEEKIKEKTTV